MKKLLFITLGVLFITLFAPVRSQAQVDSSCQIFSSNSSLNLCNGTVKRFYTKFVPGALYAWSVSGNGVIIGPRNLHYVDIQGTALGTARICVSYSANGQDPCCKCIDVNVVACNANGDDDNGGGGSCCLQYVNITYDTWTSNGPTLKIKFKDCNPSGSGIVRTRLFVDGVLSETQNWGAPINPSNTYNHNIKNPDCERIYCIRICGYDANDNLLCCTNVRGIGITCSWTGNALVGQAVEYPASFCSNNGGGGVPRTAPVKGVQESGAANIFELAPNPAGSLLKISAIPAELISSRLTITSASGNAIQSFVVSASNMDVDVSKLPAGIYRIAGTGKSGQSYYKTFVKQ
jgi:hypothetical protein